MMQLTASQTAAVRPQTVSRKASGARLVVRASQEQRGSPAQHLLAGIAAGSLLLSPVAGPAFADVLPQKAGPVFELADIGKTGGENPVPLVNEATGNKEGATRTNMPGLGDIKGPRPKSEAFSGSDSVDVPSIPNPFAKADEAKDAAKRTVAKGSNAVDVPSIPNPFDKPEEAKDAAKRTVAKGSNAVDLPSIPNPLDKADEAKDVAKKTVAKNNPLSYINVLGDLAVQEGRKPGQIDPFGGVTGQQGEAKILPSKNAKTQGLKVPEETQKQAEKQK